MTSNITKLMTICALTMGVAMPAMANDHRDDDKEAHMQKKVEHYMSKIDTNGDGKVSKSEHDAFGNQMFKEADTNGDGMISKDEMVAKKKAEHAKMKSEMRKK